MSVKNGQIRPPEVYLSPFLTASAFGNLQRSTLLFTPEDR